MTQRIRPSQFILTYGPGSIIEGKDGPRLIPSPEIGLFHAGSQLKPFEFKIIDERLSKGLLGGSLVFRLPTNDEKQMSSDDYLYQTKPFPEWKLCLNDARHGGRSYVLYRKSMCPICQDPEPRQREAIRFIAACRDGHLNDLHWDGYVHDGNDCDQKNMGTILPQLRRDDGFLWDRKGGALSDIDITCPRCGKKKNFGSIYYDDNLHCSGRNPERESARTISSSKCTKPARVIQRQAANLRIPANRTLLSIQSSYTKLHLLLQNEQLQASIKTYEKFLKKKLDTLESFMEIIDLMVSEKHLGKRAAEEFQTSSWAEISEALGDIQKEIPDTYDGLISQEFTELIKASIFGAPPVKPVKSRKTTIFEVNPNKIETVSTKKQTKFLVSPVQKLRTVTVQTGFVREISDEKDSKNPVNSEQNPPKVVDVSFQDSSEVKWYPGVEFLGEGLFIRLKDDEGWRKNPEGESSTKWNYNVSHPESYKEFVFRDGENSKIELHPGFVWWHTLSHLLIRAIGEESGYSSTSIRERIYLETESGRYRGGILIYATQPGSEGTLGGITALATRIGEILNTVLEQVNTCSGDPLCKENKIEEKGYNGASCYGCLMNSETSCEHRNMWLDRNILLENMP